MLLKFVIYIVLIFITVVIGVVKFKTLPPPFKALVFLLFITCVSESTSLFFAYNKKMSFPVYHFYVLISFWLYSYIFQLLFKNKKIKIIMIFITLPFTAFSIINSLIIQKLTTFPSYSILISSIIIVIYTLLFLKKDFDKNDEAIGSKSEYLLFNFSVLFFFTIQVFNWGIYNYLLKTKTNTAVFANFGYFSSLLFYIMLGICLLLNRNYNLQTASKI